MWVPESCLPDANPGFGFVTYELTSGGLTYPVSYVDNATGFIPVAGTVAVINNAVYGGESKVTVSSQAVVGPQDFKLRFKIVKVETREPLKRGRWTCIDSQTGMPNYVGQQYLAPSSRTPRELQRQWPLTLTSQGPPGGALLPPARKFPKVGRRKVWGARQAAHHSL